MQAKRFALLVALAHVAEPLLVRPVPVEVDTKTGCRARDLISCQGGGEGKEKSRRSHSQAWYEIVQLLHWKRATLGSKRLQSRQGFGTMTGFGGGGVGSLTTGAGAGTGVACETGGFAYQQSGR